MTDRSHASERPHTHSLRRWLVGAKIAGQGPKLTAPVDSDDHAYLFRSNEQAADVATRAVVEWLLAEAGPDGAHGSSPALRAAADRIERQEKKEARKRLRDP